MLLKNSWQKWMGLFITILLLLFLLCSSIVCGYTDTTWKMAIDAFTDFNGTNEHIVIQSVRLPRALIASAIGASLAISGVLMQTLTKNPLASPDIFGVNAGAGLAVVTGVTVFGISNLQVFTWLFIPRQTPRYSRWIKHVCDWKHVDGGLTPMKSPLLAVRPMTAMVASLTQGLLALSMRLFVEQVPLFCLAGCVPVVKPGQFSCRPRFILPQAGPCRDHTSGKNECLSMGEDVAQRSWTEYTVFLKRSAGSAAIILLSWRRSQVKRLQVRVCLCHVNRSFRRHLCNCSHGLASTLLALG